MYPTRSFALLLAAGLPFLGTHAAWAGAGLQAQAQSRTQDPLAALYDSAYFAWDAGDYPTALEQLQRLLAAPDSDWLLPRIAELTGEVWHTYELASDGRLVRWSGDGRFAAFETGAGPETRTRIVAYENGSLRDVAEISGRGLVFSPDGARVAYLTTANTPELASELQELQRRARAESYTPQRERREQQIIEARHTKVMIRELATGREWEVPAGDLIEQSLALDADGETVYLAGSSADQGAGSEIYVLRAGQSPRVLDNMPGSKGDPRLLPGGRHLLYSMSGGRFAVRHLADGATQTFVGTSPSVSADGGTLVFVGRDPDDSPTLNVVSLRDGAPRLERSMSVSMPIANPALSPDGERIAVQLAPRDDWELFVFFADGTGEIRLTRDIQHDLLPRWIDENRILGLKGEARHRRSYLYDVSTGASTRLHHNNTVRTVAPEYEWAVSPAGNAILFVADRDGNTISPERGVYLMALDRPVTRDELSARISSNLAAERSLRERGAEAFAPIADAVRDAVAGISTGRIYRHAEALYQFGSKHITQPGNALAIDYLQRALREMGYEPELQWFEPRPGIRTANVVATLRGTVDPEITYVVSSHFDSVEPSPGADDNSSGTTALLEVARVMASRPQPATIRFAWLTGEESGLLGAQEFVRRAVADGVHIAGVLNNDMVGWAGNHRLDNTIRYSNDGIRDIQHGAAIQFTDLITYDTRYYRGTDAGVFYEQYGDIVGGIGSYPILASPHYHQSHDILSNINQQLVAEVAKTTLATIMLLASSPSRLTEVTVERRGDELAVTWNPSPETGVRAYEVAYNAAGGGRRLVEVSEPRVTLTDAAENPAIEVRAIGRDGLKGWDWARPRGAANPQ